MAVQDIDTKLSDMNGATLAYMGDAVFELLVREHLILKSRAKSAVLHKRALKFVSATEQAKFAMCLSEHLSEDEAAAYRLGRNTKMTKSKTGNPIVHSKATGLEAIFGYLHFMGRQERIRELFEIMVSERDSDGTEMPRG